MANSTLAAIRTKVRRITRNPSESQLSTADLDEYVNTFIQYDFPEELRLFELRTTFTFWTQPNIAEYSTNTTTPTDPLYNFKNIYNLTDKPIYIAGYQSFMSQSREQFFGIYPMVNTISNIGTQGDGLTTTFTGTVTNGPLLQNNITFSSVDTNNNGLSLIDYPASSTTGALGLPGVPQTLPSPFGQINYLTGAFTVNFPTAPASGQFIFSETVPYVASLPQAMLYFDDVFTLRPVPDKPYPVSMEVYVRPTELLNVAQSPEFEQWWQYIAYGASKKIFQDRMDLESVQLIEPEFNKQERFVLRRTIVQMTKERAATIYTEQTGIGTGGNGWGWGGGLF